MREKERNGKRDIVRGSHQEGRTRKVEKENTGERKEKGVERRNTHREATLPPVSSVNSVREQCS